MNAETAAVTLPILWIVLRESIGPLGSLLEAIGTAGNWPKLVALGQRLEALGADLPKFIRGSRATKLKAELELLEGDGPKTPRTGSVPPSGPAAAALLLLAGALALAGALPACSPAATPEARGAQAATVSQVVYAGARGVLGELYAIHLGAQKAIQTPEQAQKYGPKLRIVLDALDRARDALAAVKPLVGTGQDDVAVRAQLARYADEVDAILPLLTELGGAPSDGAREALGLLRGFLGGAS